MNAEPNAWYIESLDVLGGIAYASHRPAIKEEGDPEPAAITYAITSPDFTPSPVGEATALGAARGVFQDLLLENEREIPFKRLEDVIEFVRRAYTSGGGGPGGGGDGGGGGGGDGDQGGDDGDKNGRNWSPVAEEGQGHAHALSSLQSRAKQFAERIDSLKKKSELGLSTGDLGNNFWQADDSVSRTDDTSLVTAARSMVTEMFRRFWRISSRKGPPDKQAMVLWSSDMNSLQWLLADTNTLSGVSSSLKKLRREILNRLSNEPDALQTLLHTYLDLPDPYWHYSWRAQATMPRTDPFERLHRVPISKAARLLLDWPSGAGEPRLGHLLSRFLASPQLAAGKATEVIVAPCLLAAASLVAPTVSTVITPSAATESGFLTELAMAAQRWLAANLPRIALPGALEQRILASASIRSGEIQSV